MYYLITERDSDRQYSVVCKEEYFTTRAPWAIGTGVYQLKASQLVSLSMRDRYIPSCNLRQPVMSKVRFDNDKELKGSVPLSGLGWAHFSHFKAYYRGVFNRSESSPKASVTKQSRVAETWPGVLAPCCLDPLDGRSRVSHHNND